MFNAIKSLLNNVPNSCLKYEKVAIDYKYVQYTKQLFSQRTRVDQRPPQRVVAPPSEVRKQTHLSIATMILAVYSYPR